MAAAAKDGLGFFFFACQRLGKFLEYLSRRLRGLCAIGWELQWGRCEGSLRVRRHAEDPAVFTWDPHFSRRNVENMGLHHVHPQKAPTNGETFEHDTCAPVIFQPIDGLSGCPAIIYV